MILGNLGEEGALQEEGQGQGQTPDWQSHLKASPLQLGEGETHAKTTQGVRQGNGFPLQP